MVTSLVVAAPAIAAGGPTPQGVRPPTAADLTPAAAGWQGTDRTSGLNRYLTAIATSQEYFSGEATAVVIATGENWPDALCAAPLAQAAGGPLLLNPSNSSLINPVLNEILRLNPASAYICGGTGALWTDVDQQLANEGIAVTRLAGATRYETAALIAEEVETIAAEDVEEYFVATGADFPDALGASSIAAKQNMPILLTLPNALVPATANHLPQGAPVYVLGGTGAVSAGVEGAIGTVTGAAVTRLAGPTRYDTAVAVVEHAVASWGTDLTEVGLSSGADFPDALAAGAGLGTRNQAQLLTLPNQLAAPSETYLRSLVGTTDSVRIFGGPGAVSTHVECRVNSIFDPTVECVQPVASLVLTHEHGWSCDYVKRNNLATAKAEVRDQNGDPVVGASVTFTWGLYSGTVSQTIMTGGDGVATCTQNVGYAPETGIEIPLSATASAGGGSASASTVLKYHCG
jgi:putative cell wall-binding protein